MASNAAADQLRNGRFVMMALARPADQQQTLAEFPVHSGREVVGGRPVEAEVHPEICRRHLAAVDVPLDWRSFSTHPGTECTMRWVYGGHTARATVKQRRESWWRRRDTGPPLGELCGRELGGDGVRSGSGRRNSRSRGGGSGRGGRDNSRSRGGRRRNREGECPCGLRSRHDREGGGRGNCRRKAGEPNQTILLRTSRRRWELTGASLRSCSRRCRGRRGG